MENRDIAPAAPAPPKNARPVAPSPAGTGAAQLELSADEIHLWCAYDEDIRGPELEEAYRRLLCPAERVRQARFRFVRDRHRFLVTRALVRTTLSRYVPVTPAQWEFDTNAYGRPHIANTDAGCAGLTFNVSHADGLIVLGVARGIRLGVDAELVAGRTASLEIARNFFAPPEVAGLQALPAHLQHDRFFEYWTLKESYIKARGEGMSIALDQFGFTFPEERSVALSIDPRQADDASAWRFLQFRLCSGHVVAVCSDNASAGRARTTIRNLVPLLSEQVLDLRPTRSSEPVAVPCSKATG